MTAKLIMTAEQVAADPVGWQAARVDGVTASEIAKVLDISPYGGPYGLYHDKIDGRETEDSDELRRGRLVEPYVLERFADTHSGLVVLPGGLYCNSAAPWQMATFDAQAIEEDTAAAYGIGEHHGPAVLPQALPADVEIFPVQAKSTIPMAEWGWAEDTDQIPAHYRAQVLWEMHIRQAHWGFVPVLFMNTWTVKTYVIERGDREEAEIAFMVAEAEEFRARVAERQEPPVDDRPSTTTILRKLYPGITQGTVQVPVKIARRYRAALAASSRAKARQRLATNQMLQLAGEAGTIVTRDGDRLVKVASRTAGPMERAAFHKDRVERFNPCGWAKGGRK